MCRTSFQREVEVAEEDSVNDSVAELVGEDRSGIFDSRTEMLRQADERIRQVSRLG